MSFTIRTKMFSIMKGHETMERLTQSIIYKFCEKSNKAIHFKINLFSHLSRSVCSTWVKRNDDDNDAIVCSALFPEENYKKHRWKESQQNVYWSVLQGRFRATNWSFYECECELETKFDLKSLGQRVKRT